MQPTERGSDYEKGKKMRLLTEKERIAIVNSIKNGWSNDEILSWAHRIMKKDVTKDMLKDIRYALKINPDYPEKKWITMSVEERETIIIRIIEGELTITQAEKAYRAGNGCGRIKKAVDDYRTAVKPNIEQAEKQTAEQTTLYGEQDSSNYNALDDIIENVEAGNCSFVISSDKAGTKITCTGADKYGNGMTFEVTTKKPLKVKFVR